MQVEGLDPDGTADIQRYHETVARDAVLDDEEKAEGECMMVCVSRCKGPRLVLDA